MLSILGFLAVLAPLVIVHELGHYFFARIFNVKAEIFSIGFGPRLWSRQIGETEWRWSAIPLGGYVKLLGEDPNQELPPELAKRALQRQPAWKRFFIFFGGPFFNFIWASIVFSAILLIGEPQMSSYVGRILPGSSAEKAGLRSGDQILKVDGQPVVKFDEVAAAIDAHPAQDLSFEIRRTHPITGATSTHTVVVPTSRTDGFSVYGESTHVGEIDGLLPTNRATTIGVSNLDTPAGKAGVRTGDRVTAWNGHPINTWEDLELAYSELAPGAKFELTVQTKTANAAPTSISWKKPMKAAGLGADFGLHSSELFIDKPVKDSPAEKTGLRPGDRIIHVAGQELPSFLALREAVQKGGEKDGKIEVIWEREGKTMTATIIPTATPQRDALLNKSIQYTIGIIPQLVWAEPKTFIERTYNPITLLYRGTERMAIFTWRNFVSIGKMFTGDVSVATLGGPILIGKIAGESLSRGLIAFLTTMAVLSIGLGVLNILPVPVLDGGHLLLLMLEIVRGKALTIRQMEIVQQVGLSLILLLMAVVIKNDLTRLPIFN